MAQRSLLHLLAAVGGGALLLFLAVGTAEFVSVSGPPNVTTFKEAEFVPSKARRPPGDAAAWKTIQLPDQWRSRPDFGGHGWYRVKLNLDQVPQDLQSIVLRKRRARRIAFFVNGKLIGSASDVRSNASGRRVGRGVDSPLGYSIPPSLLHAGENVIHVRMAGYTHPARVDGLSRIFFGEARPLRRMLIGMNEFNFQARRHAIAMALAAGIITLFLWFARRTDRVMFWYCITCLAWGGIGYLYMKLRWTAPVEITSVMSFYVRYGLVVPTLILSLRTVDLKWPRFEAALWLYFLIELSYPLWPGRPWPGAYLAWSAANTVLLLGAAVIVFYGARRPMGWPIKLQLAALTAMAAFMGFEIARFLGWVDIESPETRHYHVPLMLFALGAVCFERHARAIRQTTQMNMMLEQRVAEKAREIEANHARIESALQERARTEERQRILADMHDGLGATLVGLLRHVQANNADLATIRGRVRDALQEMRVAITALQPHGGNLTAVLGNLRERLDGLISGSGMRLVWRVEDLPTVGDLKPTAAFAIQRIVLEAVGNVLKHSAGKELRFSAHAREDKNIEIRIEDDGRGFDAPSHTRIGRGLANMQARAERIGAKFDITSAPGKGTVVWLTVPIASQDAPDEPKKATKKPVHTWLAPQQKITPIIAVGVISLLMAASVPSTDAASPPLIFELDRADFLANGALRPPKDGESWTSIALPDEWRKRPGLRGPGWYRIRFNLDDKPRGMHSLFVRHRRAYEVSFFVNGAVIGTARDRQSMADGRIGRGMGTPIVLNVPSSMLRTGGNVIHVRMEASNHPARVDGLGRVVFGKARDVRRGYRWVNEAGFASKREFVFMMIAAGLIAVFLWFARQSDRVMFWFGVTCLSWGAMGLLYLMWRWSDITLVSNFFYFYQVYGLVVPVVVLLLRTVDLRWPRFEAALWLFFAVEVTYPFWGSDWPAMHVVWDAANAGFLLTAGGIMFHSARRPMHWPIKVQLVALVTMAAVMSFEIARYLGWVDVESPVLRHYHVPMMLIAMGAACFDRYARAIREAEHLTTVLEHRVADKVREIEANHARVEAAARERTLALERQRILADMHEGLGDNLVRLLEYIDSGRSERTGIERRAQEALQEMRVAIDALQPHGGDLAAVLGALRERLEGLVAGSGVRLVWQVDELPPVQELTPSEVFSLQRIVLEAVGNVLKHGGAKHVRFIARACENKDIEIRIEDDGCGFNPAKTRGGRGLTDMRVRARRLGAALNISSQPGRGAVVRLTVHQAVMERAPAVGEPRPVTPVVPAVQPA